jgi:hypothetical protein
MGAWWAATDFIPFPDAASSAFQDSVRPFSRKAGSRSRAAVITS